MSLKTFAKTVLGEQKWSTIKSLPLTCLGLADHLRSVKNSWGGPFNGQTFRQQIFLELVEKVGFEAIVETGAFRGDTTEYLNAASQLPVYTVELHPRFYTYLKIRFLRRDEITISHADSRLFLKRLVEDAKIVQTKVFFYLDDNWGFDIPLKEEIQIIFENVSKAVVMVDDFRVPTDEGYYYVDQVKGKELWVLPGF